MKTNNFLNELKRFFIGLGSFVAVLSLTGLVYQTAATEADRRKYPAPGNLIDVGGFKMHIHCMGEGKPTVILEALSGGFSSYWAWVQSELAKQVRVCAYDRAGYGWSGPDSEPESPQRSAQNLHTLLKNAGISGSYVLVGHSKGGLYVRQYAVMYPQEVAGLVLLDSSHPDQFDRYPEMFKGDISMLSYMPAIQTLLRLGVGHAFFALGGEADFKDLPPRQHGEVAAAWASPDYWHNQETSMVRGAEIFQQAHNLGSLGDLPLAVITRGEDVPDTWHDMQAELASLSTNSLRQVVDGSTHSSLIFNPVHAHAVSQTILQVVNAVQTGKRLAP